MSEIDKIKERIGYLKVWLGIFVASDIGLFTWIIDNLESPTLMKLIMAGIAAFGIAVGVVKTHFSINKKINKLEELWSNFSWCVLLLDPWEY